MFLSQTPFFSSFCSFIGIPGYVDLEQELPGSAQTRTNVLQDFFFLSRVNQEWIGTGYTVVDGADGLGTLYRFATNIHRREIPAIANRYAPRQGPFDLFVDELNKLPAIDRMTRVADGVIHFRMRAYGTNGLLLDPFYDNQVFANITVTNDPASLSQFKYVFRSNALPTAVEIELGVVEPDVWERVQALPSVPPNETIRREHLAQQAGKVHVFRQRVPIRRVDTDAYKQ